MENFFRKKKKRVEQFRLKECDDSLCTRESILGTQWSWWNDKSNTLDILCRTFLSPFFFAYRPIFQLLERKERCDPLSLSKKRINL